MSSEPGSNNIFNNSVVDAGPAPPLSPSGGKTTATSPQPHSNSNSAVTSSAPAGTAGQSAAGLSKEPPQNVLIIEPRRHSNAPLRKLTTGLLTTYKAINTKYYEAKKARSKGGKEDYTAVVGEVLGNKYRVEESMGKGSFGQVVSATDIKSGAKVAVKVIKNKDAFRRQARTEIKILEMLNKKDPEDQWCIVRFLEQFDHGGHTCLVFEHLSFNLYELLKRTHFRGVSLTLIRKFARQILKALAYLSLPEVNIIHCDLKPENILFRVPNRSAIKVIDFGSSCSADRKMYKYIQSRFYRSPEVILELPYSQAIDMWSLGCILVEMHIGIPLFAGRDEADQMRRFVALKGMPPSHMLKASKKTENFFDVSPPADAGEADAHTGHAHAHHHKERKLARDKPQTNANGMDIETSGPISVGDPDDSMGTADVTAADAASVCSSCGEHLDSDSDWGSDYDDEATATDAAQAEAVRTRMAERRAKRDYSSWGACEPSYRLKAHLTGGVPGMPPPIPLPAVPTASTSTTAAPATSHKDPPVLTNLRDVIGVHTGGPNGRRKHEKSGHSEHNYMQFLDLLERMLEYDPAIRIKPMQALNHPFLRDEDSLLQIEAAATATASGYIAPTVSGTVAGMLPDSLSAAAIAIGNAGKVQEGTILPAPTSNP